MSIKPKSDEIEVIDSVPFWERKKLSEMSHKEWESLCDGCGICCLFKVEDEDTLELFYTDVACRMLDISTCKCKVYDKRDQKVESCIVLTASQEENFRLLPKTCAYRLLSEGKKLKSWHPLLSGNPDSVEKAGYSVKGKVHHETELDVNDIDNFVIETDICRYLKFQTKIKKEISTL